MSFSENLHNSIAADESDEDHDDGYNQKDVDKATQRVRGYKSQKPQDYKDDCDCPQHIYKLIMSNSYIGQHFA